MSEITIELYFDKTAQYKEPLSKIREQCHKISSNFTETDSENLSTDKAQQIEDEIRGLIPQVRGRIVTGRKNLLPLSNSKKLNLKNTPVVLVRQEGKLVYVFPCLLGERYYGVLDGLSHARAHMPDLPPLQGEMEDAIVEWLLKNYAIYEKDLELKGQEVDTSAGTVDLLFMDREGSHLLVEVERQATDHALGQILRLCAGYEKKCNLPRERVRGIIACARIHEFVLQAAKRAGVEIWTVTTHIHS